MSSTIYKQWERAVEKYFVHLPAQKTHKEIEEFMTNPESLEQIKIPVIPTSNTITFLDTDYTPESDTIETIKLPVLANNSLAERVLKKYKNLRYKVTNYLYPCGLDSCKLCSESKNEVLEHFHGRESSVYKFVEEYKKCETFPLTTLIVAISNTTETARHEALKALLSKHDIIHYRNKFYYCKFTVGVTPGTYKVRDAEKRMLPSIDASTLKTQKAKGLVRIQKQFPSMTVAHRIARNSNDLRERYGEAKRLFTKIFIRPCPTIPRHGFVDSRIIANETELEAMIKETEEFDSNAEFILSPYIKSRSSTTLTPTLATIGSGNDGSTAGHDSMSIPLIPSWKLPQSVLKAAGVKSAPYIEVVNKMGSYGGVRTILTQLRDGPETSLTSCGRWVPVDTKVSEIRVAGGDLLEWETWAKENAKRKGLVVWHLGGNLISHFAVHCRLNNIPILCDNEPNIGDVLKSTSGEEIQHDFESFSRGVKKAWSIKLDNETKRRGAIYALLLSCHHAMALTGDSTEILGFGVGLLLRLGFIALMGELRYSKYVEETGMPSIQRGEAYDILTPNKTYFKVRNVLPEIYSLFMAPGWSSSYGGKAWASCTKTLYQLDQAVFTGDFNKIISKFHAAVNAAHNNGWWLNKFTGDNDIATEVASGRLEPLLLAISYVYDLMSEGTNWKDTRTEFSKMQLIRPSLIKGVTLPVPKSVQWRRLETATATIQDTNHVRIQLRLPNYPGYKEFSTVAEHVPRGTYKFYRPSYVGGSKAVYATGVAKYNNKTDTVDIHAWGDPTPMHRIKMDQFTRVTTNDNIRDSLEVVWKATGLA